MAVNVCLCSDNNFAPFLATTISSILLHASDFVIFYIISDNISKKNKENIIHGTKKFFSQFRVIFFDIDSSVSFSDCISQKYISRTMYARFLIPELLKDLNTVIYSDVDVCFTGDITLLSNINIANYAIGAVPSQRGSINDNYRDFKKIYNLENNHDVFMSGLLLINCEKWRADNISQKLIALASREKFNDQIALNVFFNGNNYYKLDNKYCVIYKLLDLCFSNIESERLKKEQVIIHYPGGGLCKPWLNPQLPSADFFWKVVPYTGFNNYLSKKYNINSEKELVNYISSFRNIIIYGSGLIGKLVASRLKYYPKLGKICFAVSDLKGNPENFIGYNVYKIGDLSELDKDNSVVLLALDYHYYTEVEQTLNELQFNYRIALGRMLQNDLFLHSSKLVDEINNLKLSNLILSEKINTLFELLNYISDISHLNRATGVLRIIQRADALLLQIFHKICCKSNLAYWLDYGTLLGAVRHNGFIPWDDDLDVAMPREDYEKIVDQLDFMLGKFGIIVNRGVSYTHPVTRLLYKNTPVQLDIWPYDHIIQKTSMEEILNNIKLCNNELYKNFSITDIKKGICPFPRKYFNKLKERFIGANSKKELSTLFISGAEALPYNKPYIFKTADIFPLTTISFEGYNFFAPKHFQVYLKNIYGDYLSFPKSKVKLHGNIAEKYNSIDDSTIQELQSILECI